MSNFKDGRFFYILNRSDFFWIKYTRMVELRYIINDTMGGGGGNRPPKGENLCKNSMRRGAKPLKKWKNEQNRSLQTKTLTLPSPPRL